MKHLAQVRGLALASPALALALALGVSLGGGGCSAADTERALRVDSLGPDTPGGLVVSQVYGGGGNDSATFANDYVELFNAGTTAASVGGMSVQYASAGSGSWHVTALSTKSIPAGGYYLVAMAAGGTGGALPAADDTGTSDLAVTGGKVALVANTTALTCTVANMPNACVASSVDLVGWGNALDYAGSDPTGALSATTAALRAGAGCTDTGDNKNDFTEAAANPRNSLSAGRVCGAAPPADAGADSGADGGTSGTGGDAGDSGAAAGDDGGAPADSGGGTTADSGTGDDDDNGDDDGTDLGNIDAGDNGAIVPISDANSASCASAGALRDEQRAALSFGVLSLVTLALCRRRGASRKKVTHR